MHIVYSIAARFTSFFSFFSFFFKETVSYTVVKTCIFTLEKAHILSQ